MIPLMGFTQLALSAVTPSTCPSCSHPLRSTGPVSATRGAPGGGRRSVHAGLLTSRCSPASRAHALRRVAMCLVFLVGLAALPFAPETKGSRCRSE